MPRKRTGVWLIREGKRALKCRDMNDAYVRASAAGDTIQVYETPGNVYRASLPRISIKGVLPKEKK